MTTPSGTPIQSSTQDVVWIQIYENEKPEMELIKYFKDKTVEQNIKIYCERYNLVGESRYAIHYASDGRLLTNESSKDLEHGDKLHLHKSSDVIAEEIFNGLVDLSGTVANINRLAIYAGRSKFADEFTKRGGLTIFLQRLEESIQQDCFASFLQCVRGLWQLGKINWNDKAIHKIIDKCVTYIEQAAKNSPIAVKSVVQSLEFFHDGVSKYPDLYKEISEKVSYGLLNRCLEWTDDDIQSSSLALIVALLKGKVDRSSWKATREIIYKEDIRDTIVKNVIRRSGGIRELRQSDSKKRKSQQLLAFQHLMLNTLIGRMSLSSITPDKVKSKLDQLRKTVREAGVYAVAGADEEIEMNNETDFKILGSMNPRDPTLDLNDEPSGLLALDNMIFFSNKQNDNFRKFILENCGCNDSQACPFMKSSIALTKLLCNLLKIGDASFSLNENDSYIEVFFDSDTVFEELFCVCIQIWSKTWKEMHATSEDFNKVLNIVQEQITRSLRDNPTTIDIFKITISRLNFNQILKLLHSDIQDTIEKNCKEKVIKELTGRLTPKIKALIKQQRLNQLVKGELFVKALKKERGYLAMRLSPNYKVLHYKELEDSNIPQLDEMSKKIPVTDITEVKTDNEAQKGRGPKSAYQLNIYYKDEDNHIQELNLACNGEATHSIWCDGILCLLGKEMTSAEADNDFNTLIKMDIRLRLLEIENVKLPKLPPPIPPEPDNFNFVDEYYH
ncbi:uncharacterized protein TRIADDRAFT_55703 [Trichoplax adhaerens]|uniref:ELMO domain-containing protein n=1 Tax=Trichoplax adhaerens TaxID=10228 RepID=B3RVM3_TRIAD|nr:hypothetical protein TRIADDRAFT_55703 [Trichoplax adhaerens]EDV26021.1 hypothetical protein TRIADDRAFT_55703 [Trichoplax adhaerens]|eukprot:XP_002112054.1 hypothetical protein TRIADDRAFT_55703 [Trichoplax adhaerens]